MLLELLAVAVVTNSNPILENIKPEIKIEQVKPTIEEPKKLTVEEKIAVNHYKCDEAIYYIRADNAKCLIKPVEPVVVVQTTSSTNTKVSRQRQEQLTVRGTVSGNTYTALNCTWFVKDTVSWIPNGLGNANQWDDRARAMGYTVNNIPAAGSVGVSNSGYYGHVVRIDSVNSDGTINLTEMNYRNLGVISNRTVPASSFVYIHQL